MQNRNQLIDNTLEGICQKTDTYFQTRFHKYITNKQVIYLSFARIPHPNHSYFIVFEKNPVSDSRYMVNHPHKDVLLTLIEDLKDHQKRITLVRNYLIDLSNRLYIGDMFVDMLDRFVCTGDIPDEFKDYPFWKAYNKQKLLNQLWS